MTEAIPTLQRETSEAGIRNELHRSRNDRKHWGRESEASKRQANFPSNENKLSYG